MRRGATDASQLGLFGELAPAPPANDACARALAQEHEESARIAARLPEGIRFGTSSWSFPGWAGIVYPRPVTTQALARDGLREYVRHPLLRTVGIDRGFYAPIPEADLQRYAGDLPAGFLACAKAPEAVTSPTRIAIGSTGPREQNPDYLDPKRLETEMLEPFRRSFLLHAGPFLLQFPPVATGLAPAAFARRLSRFLEGLPRDLRYAVELRDPALLTAEYREVLQALGVAHVYNYATAMPSIAAQERAIPLTSAPFVVVRLLLRPGTRYAERKDAFAPFDRIVDPDDAMRRDVADVVARAARAGRGVFVLVNNKAEGSAPLTIRAIAARVADLLESRA